MKYVDWIKANTHTPTVVSVVMATVILGLGAFALKKLRIKPVTEAVNVATKGAKK